MYIPKLTVALSDDKSSYIGIDKDVTLYLEDGTQIFLEIKNTNPKTSDYILKWCELGCDVIEYDIKNNKFAYLFFNKEFCQKYKITKGEKCQKELLEYVRDNNINEQRFQRLYKFWLACRSKSSNDTLKSLIWEMNIEDSIWCVSQLNKANCCAETAKTLTSFIKERIISLYQREILNLIRYSFCSYYSYDYDVDGNQISPDVEPIYNEWFYREINEENTRMYTYYLSHLDWMISTNISYVESTKIYLRIFFEYLLLYKNNKSIIDINNDDIQDFEKFLNTLNISSKQHRCIIGSLYGMIRWMNLLKEDSLDRINTLCKEYHEVTSYNKEKLTACVIYPRIGTYSNYYEVYEETLKKYVKMSNELFPIKSNMLIGSQITKNELNIWMSSEHYMLSKDLEEKLSIKAMETIEKIIFGKNIYKITIIDELISLTNLDVAKCINYFKSLNKQDIKELSRFINCINTLNYGDYYTKLENIFGGFYESKFEI